MSQSTTEKIYQGVPISKGIAISPVHIMARGISAPEVHPITENQVAWEKERLKIALSRTKKQLHELQDQLQHISGNEDRIFEAHAMVLEDSSLLTRVNKAIDERHQNAEYCFYAVIQTFVESLRRVSDPYLAERASDFDDVCQRVLQNFSTEKNEDASETPETHHIIVTYELAPSETASIDRQHTRGFVTEQGSEISHTAILARSMEIPAISGIKDVLIKLQSLTPCILDGYSGKLIAHPTEETLTYYRALKEKKKAERAALDELRDQVTSTTDGREMTLSANMEFEDELPFIQSSGAQGIGLFRTEFFLLEGRNHEPPTEDEQEALYSKAVTASTPNSVIIRTLDAGGDKLPGEPLSEPEPNPFLGWRGIRFSLARQDLFKEQLRAILRASAKGNTGVMFPLVSGLQEVLEAKRLLVECMDELHHKNIPFDEQIETGVMIEVPSAAVMAQDIAQHVDFFSIGTNDLIQYTVAVDRINPRVSALYKSTHPSVLRLMKMTVDGARSSGIWTGVCGEMAGNLSFLPLLVGIGIDKLSVVSPQVPSVKKAILSLNHADCQAMVEEALKCSHSEQIKQLSKEMATACYPDLLSQ